MLQIKYVRWKNIPDWNLENVPEIPRNTFQLENETHARVSNIVEIRQWRSRESNAITNLTSGLVEWSRLGMERRGCVIPQDGTNQGLAGRLPVPFGSCCCYTPVRNNQQVGLETWMPRVFRDLARGTHKSRVWPRITARFSFVYPLQTPSIAACPRAFLQPR